MSYTETNELGQDTYHKRGSYEWWSEYDERGNQLSVRDTDGTNWVKKYDVNDNQIYFKSEDTEWWAKYDENKEMVWNKTSTDFEEFSVFDLEAEGFTKDDYFKENHY